MIAVARLIRERPRTVARTLRESFGVGLSDLGDGVKWGEAKLLLEDASGDPSTELGAELAGWAYKASLPELINIAATIGDPKQTRKVMPWTLRTARNSAPQANADEVAAATAELEDGIVFT